MEKIEQQNNALVNINYLHKQLISKKDSARKFPFDEEVIQTISKWKINDEQIPTFLHTIIKCYIHNQEIQMLSLLNQCLKLTETKSLDAKITICCLICFHQKTNKVQKLLYLKETVQLVSFKWKNSSYFHEKQFINEELCLIEFLRFIPSNNQFYRILDQFIQLLKSKIKKQSKFSSINPNKQKIIVQKSYNHNSTENQNYKLFQPSQNNSCLLLLKICVLGKNKSNNENKTNQYKSQIKKILNFLKQLKFQDKQKIQQILNDQKDFQILQNQQKIKKQIYEKENNRMPSHNQFLSNKNKQRIHNLNTFRSKLSKIHNMIQKNSYQQVNNGDLSEELIKKYLNSYIFKENLYQQKLKQIYLKQQVTKIKEQTHQQNNQIKQRDSNVQKDKKQDILNQLKQQQNSNKKIKSKFQQSTAANSTIINQNISKEEKQQIFKNEQQVQYVMKNEENEENASQKKEIQERDEQQIEDLEENPQLNTVKKFEEQLSSFRKKQEQSSNIIITSKYKLISSDNGSKKNEAKTVFSISMKILPHQLNQSSFQIQLDDSNSLKQISDDEIISDYNAKNRSNYLQEKQKNIQKLENILNQLQTGKSNRKIQGVRFAATNVLHSYQIIDKKTSLERRDKNLTIDWRAIQKGEQKKQLNLKCTLFKEKYTLFKYFYAILNAENFIQDFSTEKQQVKQRVMLFYLSQNQVKLQNISKSENNVIAYLTPMTNFESPTLILPYHKMQKLNIIHKLIKNKKYYHQVQIVKKSCLTIKMRIMIRQLWMLVDLKIINFNDTKNYFSVRLSLYEKLNKDETIDVSLRLLFVKKKSENNTDAFKCMKKMKKYNSLNLLNISSNSLPSVNNFSHLNVKFEEIPVGEIGKFEENIEEIVSLKLRIDSRGKLCIDETLIWKEIHSILKIN